MSNDILAFDLWEKAKASGLTTQTFAEWKLDREIKPEYQPYPVQINVTEDEFHTIIAALRYYQQQGMGDPDNRSDEIHLLATNDGKVFSSLDDEGIDTLIERINLE